MQEVLRNGLDQLGIDCSESVQSQFLVFLRLLAKWNRVYNLTAIRDLNKMVTGHILDSLSVLPFVEAKALDGARLLDVGAGAGLPGIPLALMLANIEFVLVDSNSKKTRFMRQVVIELNIKNIDVLHSRVEEMAVSNKFDVILSRAFSSIEHIIKSVGQLCAPTGAILMMKGDYPTGELCALPDGYTLKAVHQLKVPGIERARHLVEIQPTRPSGCS